ncbi:MAG TPA: cbb3-type cytochrome c oxidase subunit I [Acidimicrobiales bacterium]
MAITETRPATEAELATPEPVRFVGLPDHDPGGFAGFIGTGDHKGLGIAYLVVGSVFGIAALVADLLFHAEQAASFLPKDRINEVFTLGRVGGVLLFAIPVMVGLATYVTPLQVGANTVAFPRAAAAAFWGWLVGSGMVIAAYAINGGPDGTATKAVDLFYVALALVVVSLLIASVCVVTTVIALRTPGLWLTRVPLFSWSMVVACSLWLLTLPVLLADVVILYLDHHYGTGAAFAADQFGHLGWIFGVPQLYVVAIPVLGIVSDVIATLAGVRQPQRGLMMTAIGAFGVLSFGAYAQPAFNPLAWNQALYVGMGVLILLPVLALVAGWAVTLRAGKPSVQSPLLFAFGTAILLLLSVTAGAVFVIRPFDLHGAGWTAKGFALPPYASGLFLLVLAAVTMGLSAGLTFWAPKLFGRFAKEGIARLAALVGLLGGLVAGLPLLVYGFALKSSGLADAAKFLNGTSAVGTALVIVGLALVWASLLGTADEVPADDSWGRGQSLEWTTSSPPVAGNFGVLDLVRSPEPLLDAAESEVGS